MREFGGVNYEGGGSDQKKVYQEKGCEKGKSDDKH